MSYGSLPATAMISNVRNDIFTMAIMQYDSTIYVSVLVWIIFLTKGHILQKQVNHTRHIATCVQTVLDRIDILYMFHSCEHSR